MAKSEKIKIICEYCGKEFELTAGRVRAREKALGHKIRFCSQKCMGMANKKAKVVECLNCGKEFETTRHKFCSPKCASDYHKKMGTHIKNGYWFENGYKVLYLENNKSIKEHIKIMEEKIGRKLQKNEVVHHKDFNSLNNNIDNLVLMTRGEHSRLHRQYELATGKKLFV